MKANYGIVNGVVRYKRTASAGLVYISSLRALIVPARRIEVDTPQPTAGGEE